MLKRNVQYSVEGLFEMLSNQFKPQYNEMIKSLQFRQLYWHDEENIEEWMERLHVAAVEYNYQEVDDSSKSSSSMA